MDRNTEKALLTLGLIGGIYYAYQSYMAHRYATKSPTPAPTTPGIMPVLPVAVQTAMPAAPPVTQTTLSSPNGIDPTVYSTVMQWVNSDGRPPVLAFGAAAVPAEFAGMYDIIVNAWGKGLNPTTAQSNFWNGLRNEYDPLHKYW